MATTTASNAGASPCIEGLPAELLLKIFKYAGREGSAAAQVAFRMGFGANEDARKKLVDSSEEALQEEPFTYWDWQGLSYTAWARKLNSLDDQDPTVYHADGRKRRLLREHERGFKIKGDIDPSMYPSPSQRWKAFQDRVYKQGKFQVKRLAICHWMTLNDLVWIAEELPTLEALDLSHVSENENEGEVDSRTSGVSWTNDIDDLEQDGKILQLFKRLKWLGVPDWRRGGARRNIFESIVPQCKNLETLSIRGKYTADLELEDGHGAHEYICFLILGIEANVPETVTHLELRMSVPFIGYFIDKLRKLKSTIQHVGIDLGAWVQIYPLRKPKTELSEEEIRKCANAEAHRHRFEAYKEQHNAQFTQSTRWLLPDTSGDIDPTQDVHLEEDLYKLARPNFYRDNGGTDFTHEVYLPASTSPIDQCQLDETNNHSHTQMMNEHTRAKTLSQMLMKLYHARNKGAILYPLEAEQEQRSTNAIHPLALTQDGTNDLVEFNKEDLPEVYNWLGTTFKWRPVFDWDWFMAFDRMKKTEDCAYTPAGNDYWITDALDIDGLDITIGEVTEQLERLREAGIPIHLLIGRRNPELSSLYWGWPYNEDEWTKWLQDSFEANLDEIAGLVDILSVLYDIRSPLDADRLGEIQAKEPHRGPPATCPSLSMLCPLYERAKCPFTIHRNKQQQASARLSSESGQQKMANKRSLKALVSSTPRGYDRLASGYGSAPPTGENANVHPSDDSDIEDSPTQSNLYHLARRAAFAREAVGWQRFWKKYALKFSSLTALHVRMPRSFDKVGSWRLAKLLNQRMDWKMITYTDERQHVQTDEDLLLYIDPGDGPDFTYQTGEAKVYPAGRFVRRSWIWDNVRYRCELLGPKQVVLDAIPAPEWGKRKFNKSDSEDTEAGEHDELLKAIERAKNAANQEREYEIALSGKPAGSGQGIDPMFQTLYGSHIRRVFGEQYRNQIELFMDEIQHEIDRLKDVERTFGQSHEVELEVLGRTREALRQNLVRDVPLERCFRKSAKSSFREQIVQGYDWEEVARLSKEEKRCRNLPPYTPPPGQDLPSSTKAVRTTQMSHTKTVIKSTTSTVPVKPHVSGHAQPTQSSQSFTHNIPAALPSRQVEDQPLPASQTMSDSLRREYRGCTSELDDGTPKDKSIEDNVEDVEPFSTCSSSSKRSSPPLSLYHDPQPPKKPKTTFTPKLLKNKGKESIDLTSELSPSTTEPPSTKLRGKSTTKGTTTTSKRKKPELSTEDETPKSPPAKRQTRTSRKRPRPFKDVESSSEGLPNSGEESDGENDKGKKKQGKRPSRAEFVPHDDFAGEDDDDKPSGTRSRGRGGRGSSRGRGAGSGATTGKRRGKRKATPQPEIVSPVAGRTRRAKQRKEQGEY